MSQSGYVILPLEVYFAGAMTWSPDGRYLAAADGEDFIIVWDLSDPQRTLKSIANSQSISPVLWGEDSEHILLSALEEVEIWNVETELKEISFDIAGKTVDSLDWENDVIVGNPNDENSQFIRIWQASTGNLIREIEATNVVFSVALSPDGTQLAYGDGEILQVVPVSETTCNPMQTVAAGDKAGVISAITAANANSDVSIIGVDGTYTFTAVHNNSFNALPRITTDITICSQNGATLTRGTSAPMLRFFDVRSNGKLTLDNLTLSGGNIDEDEEGGAIDNLDGQLQIQGSTFTGNEASDGGAIRNYGGTVTLTTSMFTSNAAEDDGGALNNAGGTVTITDTQFQTNTATTRGGVCSQHRSAGFHGELVVRGRVREIVSITKSTSPISSRQVAHRAKKLLARVSLSLELER